MQPTLHIAVGLLDLRVGLAMGHVHRLVTLMGQLGRPLTIRGLEGPVICGPRGLAMGGVYSCFTDRR